jgi:hypothetical protein
MWDTLGNFLSSLNLSFTIMMYGSPRNFWDGLDEKAVQRVKGKLTHLNLASTSWLATILDKVMREQTLRMMLEKRSPGHRRREVSQGNMRVFPSLEYLQTLFNQRKGFCGFMLEDNPVDYFIACKSSSSRKSAIRLERVSVENCIGSYIGGIWYSRVNELTASTTQRLVDTVEELATTVSWCVLFLPLSHILFPEKEEPDRSWMFHVMDVDHNVLGPTGWSLMPIYPVDIEPTNDVE